MAKATKRDMFVDIAGVLAGLGETDKVEFIEAQIALLDKRKTGTRKMTKGQEANIELKEFIASEVLGDEGLTATDIAGHADVAVQKVSALMKQLIDEGRAVRVEGKGKVKTTFLAVTDEG